MSATLPGPVRGLLDSENPAADLFDIAGSCFAVDRVVPRPRADAWRDGPEWARSVAVRIPVRHPEFWQQHESLLEGLLNWMTADEWSLNLREKRQLHDPQQTALDIAPPGTVVALFSGGLDSTAGLALDAESPRHRSSHAVSVATNPGMHHRQKDLIDELWQLAGRKISLLDWTPFKLNMLGQRCCDKTARTRGFVFLSAGVVAAIGHGSNTLRIYENGTGALNLACTRGQVGAQAARAVHPRTLKIMRRIAAEITGNHFEIENPYRNWTKSELVGKVPDSYNQMLESSVSCDTGFSHHTGEPAHCGGCTSCVLRNQALTAAGKPVRTPTREKVPEEKEVHPDAMKWQVARLRHAFARGRSWHQLVAEFPDILCAPGALDPAHQAEVMDLLHRYAAEWQAAELT